MPFTRSTTLAIGDLHLIPSTASPSQCLLVLSNYEFFADSVCQVDTHVCDVESHLGVNRLDNHCSHCAASCSLPVLLLLG